MPALSPLAPERFPDLPEIPGVRLAAGSTGTRYKGRNDLLLVELAPGTTVAGVYTKSSMISAPCEWSRNVTKRGRARALIANAGNANTFTGRDGVQAVKATATAVAKLMGAKADEVLVT